MVKTIYLNIEDDIQTVTQKIARTDSTEVVLVFPKRSFLFSDAINLRLLKKQTDYLGKSVFILTMDEVGQVYAKEAGFALKTIAQAGTRRGLSDIGARTNPYKEVYEKKEEETKVPEIRMPIRQRTETVAIRRQSKIAPAQPHVMIKETKYSGASSVAKNSKANHINNSEFKKKSPWKITLGFFLPILLIGALIGIFVLPEGKVVVYPKTDTVVRDLEITSGSGVAEIDSSKMVIPATKIIKTLSLQDNFQSAGKKEVGTKSTGKILIYNLTGKPINLRAGTTVLKLGNKSYQFTEDQNNIKAISPSSIQSGNSSKSDVDVTAVSGGEDFNIPAGTRLEITNQVFGSQPQVLYAKTQTAILGGTSRYLSVITDEDFKNAQTQLVQKMVDQLRLDFQSEGKQLVDGAYTAEIVEFQSDKISGTESPSFQATVKATIKGLLVSKNQIASIVEERIIKSLPETQKLINSLDGSLTVKAKDLNFDTGLMVLSVHVEAKSSTQIDLSGVQKDLLGKSKQQVSDILLSRPDIEKIEVTLSPYWQKTMPKFATKVKVEIAR